MNQRAIWDVVKILPTDYKEYGGAVERWQDTTKDYPDCSSGCRYYWRLDGDWGVCTNPRSARAGLLTWEHQAGHLCFELPIKEKRLTLVK
jgi:hypothetical protein